jgi:thiamine biosynthesis lipoprotein
VSIKRFVETWGTVVVIEATSSALDEVAVSAAVDEVEEFLFQVDRDFSTYKEDSQVSRIRRGELKIEDASEYVQQVWVLCEFSREITMGAFDPWKAEGGFDPSGLVKGWAAEVGAQMLVEAGAQNVLINASGDIVLRGGKPEGGPWNIGIASPDDVEKYVKFFDVVDGSVATSGDYEKGAHIVDPHTGLIAIGARSATVIGPDGAICDALATALMVDGIDAQKWIGRAELAEYSFWTINRHDGTAWSYGLNKGKDLRVALND